MPAQPSGADRPRPTRAQAAGDARGTVGRHGAAVRAAAEEKYQVRNVVIDPDGSRHVRFDRTYRGLPVLGGDYVVHANPDGSFRDASVAQRQKITTGVKPAITVKRATAAAVKEFGDAYQKTDAHLVIDAAQGTPVLAWQVVVTADEPRELNVVVDARSGAVRRTFEGVHGAETGTGRTLYNGEVPLTTTRRDDGAYTLTDPTRGDATVLSLRGTDGSEPLMDADNVWGDGTRADPATVAADVSYGLAETYDYFKEQHGRSGVRDDGSVPDAQVHYDDANAYYDDFCYCMGFGDGDAQFGPFVSLDIVGHEYAHAVTDATAALIYDGESGGLNEATSDIFGTLIEFAADNPQDRPDYLVGEKTGVTLRYMDDPARDFWSASCWSPSVGYLDVHESSGVGNKFFYTLAAGSGESAWGNSPTCAGAPPVTGIGNEKAGRIWYRALTVYMLSNTNFAGARQATLKAATDLYGADSTEFAAVDAAWKAVNVDGSLPVPQEPAVTRPDIQYRLVGDAVSLQIQARDPQGDELTFTATDLPEGLSISTGGLISGTITKHGSKLSTVTATDPAGHAGVTSVYWAISGPPVVRPMEDRTGVVGEEDVFFVFVTDDGIDITYSWSGLPPGVNGYDSLVWGTPEQPGVYPVTLTVTDDDQRSTTATFTWTVNPA
ncbi:M4 family metallopeptidase [Actinoplanes sp. DH11]|uniref:M4 family metallopeptidase n=1 Tax=Actinoplanes sp. DH11 TaxID=2857011 RepID=UPI001E3AEE61|nr:M4 family metallopeptidase [Actinoplanes sp. DH11]